MRLKVRQAPEESHRNLRPYAERTQYFLIPVNSWPERSLPGKVLAHQVLPAQIDSGYQKCN